MHSCNGTMYTQRGKTVNIWSSTYNNFCTQQVLYKAICYSVGVHAQFQRNDSKRTV